MTVKIDPRAAFALNFAIFILSGVASGAVHFDGLLPDPTAHAVVGWGGVGLFVMSGLNMCLHGWSADSSGPFVKNPVAPVAGKLGMLLIGGLITSALIFGGGTKAHAAPAPKRATFNISALVAKVKALTLADVQNAAMLADNANDANGFACYQGILNVLNELNPPANTPGLALPHLLSDFEQTHIIVMQLRAGAPLRNACAPLADEVKQDVLSVVAAVAGGTLSLSTFGL